MTKWSDETKYQGKRVNQGTAQICEAANKLLALPKYGGEKEDFTMMQGGYNKGGVSASAGTHDGGAAFDTTPFNIKNRVKVFRLLGVAFWERVYIRDLWPHHGHGIVCGDGTASRGARLQVEEYYGGGDGLRGDVPDREWRPRTLPLLFKFNGDLGKMYLNRNITLRDEPDVKGAATQAGLKNDVFHVIATVRADDTYWCVSSTGDWIKTDYLSTSLGEVIKPDPIPEPVPIPEPEPEPEPTPPVKVKTVKRKVKAFYMNRSDYDSKHGAATAGDRTPEVAKVAQKGRPLWILMVENRRDQIVPMDKALPKYKRVETKESGAGREAWFERGKGIVILYSDIKYAKPELKGDDKPFLVIVWTMDGFRNVTIVFHNENEGTTVQRGQLKFVCDKALEVAEKWDVPDTNVFIAGDTNYTGAISDLHKWGWKEAGADAKKSVRAWLNSFGGWKKAVKGPRIDISAIKAGKFVKYIQRTKWYKVADHFGQFSVRYIYKKESK